MATLTPNEHANYSPTDGSYSGIKPFRAWVQMVLPQVYNDALSYQELVYKLLSYINTLIDDVDTVETNVTQLHEAYDKLEAYINSYFDELDLQEEVNVKLDEMASDGSLSALIEPFIPSLVTAWLNENITQETGYVLDSSLTVESAAADAKAVGDEISTLTTYYDSLNAAFNYTVRTVGAMAGDSSDVNATFTAYSDWGSVPSNRPVCLYNNAIKTLGGFTTTRTDSITTAVLNTINNDTTASLCAVLYPLYWGNRQLTYADTNNTFVIIIMSNGYVLTGRVTDSALNIQSVIATLNADGAEEAIDTLISRMEIAEDDIESLYSRVNQRILMSKYTEQIGTNDNLNSYSSDGIFYCSSSHSQSLNNMPESLYGKSFFLWVNTYESSIIGQYLFPLTTGVIYARVYQDSDWGDWVLLSKDYDNDISNIESDISEINSEIDTLTNSVSTNTSNISTNASNIATNTASITTNADNISTNATDISTLTEKLKFTVNTEYITLGAYNSTEEYTDYLSWGELKRNQTYRIWRNALSSLGYVSTMYGDTWSTALANYINNMSTIASAFIYPLQARENDSTYSSYSDPSRNLILITVSNYSGLGYITPSGSLIIMCAFSGGSSGATTPLLALDEVSSAVSTNTSNIATNTTNISALQDSISEITGELGDVSVEYTVDTTYISLGAYNSTEEYTDYTSYGELLCNHTYRIWRNAGDALGTITSRFNDTWSAALASYLMNVSNFVLYPVHPGSNEKTYSSITDPSYKYVLLFSGTYSGIGYITTAGELLVLAAFSGGSSGATSPFIALQTALSDISTNTANIATNTSNIATNTANIATNTTNIATNKTNISSLTDDVDSINDTINSLSYDYLTNIVYGGDGYYYKLQVNSSGELTPIKTTPSNIFVYGNSISVGMTTFGAAATSSDKDWTHVIQTATGASVTARKTISILESSVDAETSEDYITRYIDAYADDTVDLVLFQMGDNVNSDEKREIFAEYSTLALQRARKAFPNAIVAVVGTWYNRDVNAAILQNACANSGAVYVDIRDLYSTDLWSTPDTIITLDSAASVAYTVNWFSISSDYVTLNFDMNGSTYEASITYDSYESTSGVSISVTGTQRVVYNNYSHPNDEAHRLIAERVMDTLKISY